MYSGKIDRVSLLAERLTSKCLEEYVENNIANCMGAKSFTWYFLRKLQVADKLMHFSARPEDSKMTRGSNPF